MWTAYRLYREYYQNDSKHNTSPTYQPKRGQNITRPGRTNKTGTLSNGGQIPLTTEVGARQKYQHTKKRENGVKAAA